MPRHRTSKNGPAFAVGHFMQRAIAAFQRGDWVEAERQCRTILVRKTDHFDALHLSGIIAANTKRASEACEFFTRAIAANPRDAIVHGNLGNALLALRRPEAALPSYERAIALKPDLLEAHINRGNALRDLQRPEEALSSYDRAIQLNPRLAEAHYDRGVALADLRRSTEALQSFDTAITLKSDFAAAHFNRGAVLRELKRPEDALQSYERAIEFKPDYCEARFNQGRALLELGQFEEALQSFDRAIALRPDHAEAFYHRGNALQQLDRPDEALQSLEQAISLETEHAGAYNSRGVVLVELGRSEEALQSYERAIALAPDYTSAHYNLATCRLALGDFANGWPEYEWRRKLENVQDRQRLMVQPIWLGTGTLTDKTILLHSEQGLGDTLQFSRFARDVAVLGATVVLEVQQSLMRVLAGLPGVAQLVAEGSPLPAFEYQCPLLSLPLALGTDLRSIGAAVPYVRSDANLVAAWKERLGAGTKPRIGVVWSGNAAQKNDLRRSIPLSTMLPLIGDSAEWISLQKEVRESDKAVLASRPDIREVGEMLHDFADTAAVIESLDLVITVDTSVAHLAGAMGKKVWILLSQPQDWRWLLNRADSPWYPTARLFRQESRGDWSSVIADVEAELRKFLSSQ